MTSGLTLFCRGFLIVILTAMNVYQVAHAHYGGAFLVGTAISIVWWTNARTSSQAESRFGAIWYGLGAGCGTVAGMALMRWVYG